MREEVSGRRHFRQHDQPAGIGRTGVKNGARWNQYLWIAEIAYIALGVFNILFAWLGLIFFLTPLLIAIFKGDKAYCNRYCGRGQLYEALGGKLGLPSASASPAFLRLRAFRYGFLAFFMAMFCLMIYQTATVFMGAPLSKTVTFLWAFRLPWNWPDVSMASPGVAQGAFGFYGVMLTSEFLGLLLMLLFRPRSWCVCCPMGTMTQAICRLKNRRG
jgi:hypothetical protein